MFLMKPEQKLWLFFKGINMRDIYVWFSIVYFIAGGIHLYQMHRIVKNMEKIVINMEKK